MTEPVRATLAAVAKLAGVSPSTASLAFNGSGPVAEATRERVRQAALELGYDGPDPRARSLRRGRSGIIGVVLEEALREAFRDPMNLAMLDGIADVTGAAGNSLLLLTESAGPGSALVDAPIDAAVLFGCSPVVDDKVRIVQKRGIPVVAIEGRPLPGVVDVGLDSREATRALAAHLHDLGHRRVALVTLELDRDRHRGVLNPARIDRATSFTALERIRGGARGLPLDRRSSDPRQHDRRGTPGWPRPARPGCERIGGAPDRDHRAERPARGRGDPCGARTRPRRARRPQRRGIRRRAGRRSARAGADDDGAAGPREGARGRAGARRSAGGA